MAPPPPPPPSQSTPLDPELLLAQSDWVRSLARRLVGNADEADDVAQSTMLAALERPPRNATNERSLRAWLAQVVRSAAHVGRRSDTRRRYRERVAARSDIADSTADIVARAAQLQLVVKALMELDEPYRSTLLLAYFDGLTSAQIADRMGLSDVAVRKRASRGLARLRARLDAEHDGDRNAWVSAFAPWLSLGLVPEAKLGAGTVAKVAAVLLAAGTGSFFLRAPSGPPAGGDTRAVAIVMPADSGTGESAEHSTGGPASEVATPGRLGVRLVDRENGRPLEGVRIEIAGAHGTRAAQLVATDFAGWARFRVPAGDALVAVARGSELASADSETAIAPLAPGEARLVTLSLETTRYVRALGGRVFDAETGAPIAGASVRPAARPAGCSAWSAGAALLARADREGRFRVPLGDAVELLAVEAPGYAGALIPSEPEPERDGRDRAVPLWRSAALAAVVLDARGRPLAGARVRLTARAADVAPLVPLADPEARFSWTAPTGRSAGAFLDGLPPDVPLDVEIAVAGRVVLRPTALELEPGSVQRAVWRVAAGTPVAEHSSQSFGTGTRREHGSVTAADRPVALWTESGSDQANPGSPDGGDPPRAFDDVWGMGGAPGNEPGAGKIGNVGGNGPSVPLGAIGIGPLLGPSVLGPGSAGVSGGRAGGAAFGLPGLPDDSQAALAGPPGDGPATSGQDAGLGPVAGGTAGGPNAGGPGDSTGSADVAWIRIATTVPATYVVLAEEQVVAAGVLAPGDVVTHAITPGLGQVRARVADTAARFRFAATSGETVTAALAR